MHKSVLLIPPRVIFYCRLVILGHHGRDESGGLAALQVEEEPVEQEELAGVQGHGVHRLLVAGLHTQQGHGLGETQPGDGRM